MTDIFAFCPECNMPKLMTAMRFLLNTKFELCFSLTCSGCKQELQQTTGIKIDQARIIVADEWGKKN